MKFIQRYSKNEKEKWKVSTRDTIPCILLLNAEIDDFAWEYYKEIQRCNQHEFSIETHALIKERENESLLQKQLMLQLL